jgi:hypothetical protein
MSDTFQIGEIAIFYHPGSVNHGREVMIIGPLEHGRVKDTWTGNSLELDFHRIDASNLTFGPFESGGQAVGRLSRLRKKKPPREDLQVVKWSECPWQPAKVSA